MPRHRTVLRFRSAFSPSRARLPVVLVAFLLSSLFLVGPAAAQEADDIVDRLDGRFEAIQLSDGWLLRPSDPRDDLGAIELRNGRVLVDGERVDEEELRRFVDSDAAVIFALAEGRSLEPPAPPEPPEQEFFLSLIHI